MTGASITVYEKPTCTTCRKVVALLTEREVPFTRVDYFTTPLDAAQLGQVLARAGLRPRDVVRTKEPGARDLPLDDDAAMLDVLVAQPAYLQRPLVVRGDRAILARPPETVLALLD